MKRFLKRKKNEIEYLTEEQKERYFNRVIIINAIVVIALLSAILVLK